ncbi:MAG: tetratricopeptide repeat protein [Paracoccaceae bacterium]
MRFLKHWATPTSEKLLKTWGGLTLSLVLLTACESAGGQGFSADDSATPPGIDTSGQSIDPLLVGHRLMAAGEYELALKSFLRAGGEQGLNTDVLSALGSANLMLGRLGQAEVLLRRAVKEDDASAPAWNNLGVVLMEQNEFGEAERVFRTAYALDSGESVEIRDNLRLALANLEDSDYSEPENNSFALVHSGVGKYLLLSQP